ncbi:glutathione-dependent formaldehyde-activating GFA [Rippkaea orientalis PCC 8801]|uniref:Glutathione-dependent formaldehyde-activating GFA n=1 Tax=Rippkaea orientalis (strain PCC 8801 / RF-1) TaxID=41431 RepID=B7K448_RIPO1|nr:GFA family protein [Rippkaea orientalis]ACK67754.1 glutathione-dependent formaldehyde-activating GFA [Rippkaea orientalis PCC 8801]
MPLTPDSNTYLGGCHCGAVRFSVVIDNSEAIDCNCSICRKKGFLHVLLDPENFTLLQGSDALTTYTFNTHTAQHTFCRICGIHPFYRPRSHPDKIDVNLRCLDENLLSKFQITPFDGENWEDNVEAIRKLN